MPAPRYSPNTDISKIMEDQFKSLVKTLGVFDQNLNSTMALVKKDWKNAMGSMQVDADGAKKYLDRGFKDLASTFKAVRNASVDIFAEQITQTPKLKNRIDEVTKSLSLMLSDKVNKPHAPKKAFLEIYGAIKQAYNSITPFRDLMNKGLDLSRFTTGTKSLTDEIGKNIARLSAFNTERLMLAQEIQKGIAISAAQGAPEYKLKEGGRAIEAAREGMVEAELPSSNILSEMKKIQEVGARFVFPRPPGEKPTGLSLPSPTLTPIPKYTGVGPQFYPEGISPETISKGNINAPGPITTKLFRSEDAKILEMQRQLVTRMSAYGSIINPPKAPKFDLTPPEGMTRLSLPEGSTAQPKYVRVFAPQPKGILGGEPTSMLERKKGPWEERMEQRAGMIRTESIKQKEERAPSTMNTWMAGLVSKLGGERFGKVSEWLGKPGESKGGDVAKGALSAPALLGTAALTKGIKFIGKSFMGTMDLIKRGAEQMGMLNPVSNAFNTVLNTFGSILSISFIPLMNQIFATFFSPESMAMLNSIGLALKPLVEVLGQLFTTIFNLLKPLFDVNNEGSLLSVIINGLIKIFDALNKVFSDPEVKAALDSLMNAFSTIFGVIFDALATVLPIILPPLIAIADIFVNILAEVFKLFADLLPIFAPLIQEVGELLQMMAESVFEVLREILPIIEPILETVVGFLVDVAGIVIEGMKEAIAWITKAITALTDALNFDWQGAAASGRISQEEANVGQAGMGFVNWWLTGGWLGDWIEQGIQAMDSQGTIDSTGLAKVHKGELVVKKELVSDIVKNFQINNTFNSPTDPLTRMEYEDSLQRLF